MAGNLSIHPAPGLGDLLPGWYAVPQNPVDIGLSGIGYTSGIGEILPGSFAVPQNPLKDYTAGRVRLIGQQSSSSGSLNGSPTHDCGCGGSCGGCGSGSGMGTLSTDFSQLTTDLSSGNFSAALSDSIAGIPASMWLIGIAVAFFAFSGSTGPSRYSRARRAYRAYAS